MDNLRFRSGMEVRVEVPGCFLHGNLARASNVPEHVRLLGCLQVQSIANGEAGAPQMQHDRPPGFPGRGRHGGMHSKRGLTLSCVQARHEEERNRVHAM